MEILNRSPCSAFFPLYYRATVIDLDLDADAGEGIVRVRYQIIG